MSRGRDLHRMTSCTGKVRFDKRALSLRPRQPRTPARQPRGHRSCERVALQVPECGSDAINVMPHASDCRVALLTEQASNDAALRAVVNIQSPAWLIASWLAADGALPPLRAGHFVVLLDGHSVPALEVCFPPKHPNLSGIVFSPKTGRPYFACLAGRSAESVLAKPKLVTVFRLPTLTASLRLSTNSASEQRCANTRFVPFGFRCTHDRILARIRAYVGSRPRVPRETIQD